MKTQLQITAVRAILLSYVYPAGQEMTWVGGTIHSWDAALVEVTLADGSVGVGEVGAGIMAAVAVPGLLEAYQPYCVNVSFDHPLHVGDWLRAHTAFWSRGGIASGVAGAIEIAAVDAVGKREGLAAYELLGGLRRDRIEAYASGGLGSTFDDVATWGREQIAAGFSTIKFRGMRDADTTIELMEYVVPQLPTGTGFILDVVQACASQAWSHDDALRVGRVAQQLGARWYEEPCFATDVAGYAKMRAELGVRISGVESNGTVDEFAALLLADAIGLAQPDVTFVGGFATFARVADMARAHDVACVPHVWGSGVTFAANLHAAFAHDHVQFFEFCTLVNPLRELLLTEVIGLRDGELLAPRAPGLGVAVTPEIERAFPFQRNGGHVIR
ncbi:MAG: mandelate racemase/muconate lactonizing enzyme family protein [Actinomycetota bacterium]